MNNLHSTPPVEFDLYLFQNVYQAAFVSPDLQTVLFALSAEIVQVLLYLGE